MMRALAYFEGAWGDKPVLIQWVRAYFTLAFLNLMNLVERQTFPEIGRAMASTLAWIVQ
ncbi:MAG: hypothetical protein FD177_779 [Desulfovibrionaceae bacterium]|nr:MAG: hypothetical protein FD177_779 [Desulfovibrionaceae bacterium]